MNLLIIYGTTEGHTRTICEFLKEEAEAAGHSVLLLDASENQESPEGYDVAIIAASMHAGKYQTTIGHYVEEHRDALNLMESVFLSVSLTAASNEPESWKELEKQTDEFLASTGWEPSLIEQVAGALLYTKYDFFKRFIMRMITSKAGGDTDTSKDYVYTDWNQVKGVLRKLSAD
jgi:menaquinone-dependent protoporphyrinogen oxidase